LLNLCNAFLGRYVGRETLAAEACDVELNRLGEPIGKQDQYSCAIGGLNFIQFHPDDSVTCEPVPLSREMRRQVEQNLVMIYLGGTRSASAVLKEQAANIEKRDSANDELRAMVAQAELLRHEIVRDPDVLGPFLHEGWMRKKRLAQGISSPQIDDAYDRAMAAGASGGKLLGAGGSGFLLFYAPGDARAAVVDALSDYRAYDVVMDTTGTTIIYSN
jgi:D-glycero-alpha-D-manno-heptose-7-phosphate kinase